MRCNTCDTNLVLRIPISPTNAQRLIFPCPTCNVSLHLLIETPGPPTVRLISSDLAEGDQSQIDNDAVIVNLSSDLPVPIKFIYGSAAPQEFFSPFLYLSNLMPMEEVADCVSRMNALNEFHNLLFARLRRLVSLYQSGNFDALDSRIDTLPVAIEELDAYHPIYRLHRFIQMLYLPAIDLVDQMLATNVIVEAVLTGSRAHPLAYKDLLQRFDTEMHFAEHRRKVVASSFEVLENVDALFTGLAWERIPEGSDVSVADYRVARDDFNETRSRYVDIFELASRTLVFVGALVNLASRGSAESWCDGSTKDLSTVWRFKAWQREFILTELPSLQKIYLRVHRASRNQFGHYALEYDFASGNLVDHDGSTTNYILFLVDYLAAARLSFVILTVVEDISLELVGGAAPYRDS
jgi:hypothetical protein